MGAGTNIGTVVKIWELLLDLILSMGRVEVREVVEGFVDVEDSEDALGLIINTLSLNYFCHFIFTIKQVTYNYVFVRCFKIKDYGCRLCLNLSHFSLSNFYFCFYLIILFIFK